MRSNPADFSNEYADCKVRIETSIGVIIEGVLVEASRYWFKVRTDRGIVYVNLVSFDVEAPPGSFKREYSEVRDEASWLCAKPDNYRSTYVCRSEISAELLASTIASIFGDSLRRIALCPVKPNGLEHKLKVEKLLNNTRSELLRRFEEALERCRTWTRRARSRFMDRVRRLRVIDASLADDIELRLRECFEYTSNGESSRGSSMVRGGELS